VTAEDAVRSVLSAGRGGADSRGGAPALRRAAERLASALARREDRLCDPDDDGVWECAPAAGAHFAVIPPVTSADLRAFAARADAGADYDTMSDLAEAVTALVAADSRAVLPPLPALDGHALPTRVVPVTDEEGVLSLEADVQARVDTLEGVQAALATRLEAAVAALESSRAQSRP
jgi:hypothetical protein